MDWGGTFVSDAAAIGMDGSGSPGPACSVSRFVCKTLPLPRVPLITHILRRGSCEGVVALVAAAALSGLCSSLVTPLISAWFLSGPK